MPPLKKGMLLAQSDVMIVDDKPANLQLLEHMLLEKGHEVRSFPLGRLALAAAAKHPPDLILLDINMPEMNGYEVCRSFKAIEKLRNIPVIFLSALSEMPDKVEAFRSGGVDYISKPFQVEEVHARVETHLKLHSLQRKLELQNESLEAAVALRTRELAEANARLTVLDHSKNDFLKLISHEFRTPLHGLLGVGELLLEELPSGGQTKELRGIFERSRRRILSIIDDALLLTEIDVRATEFRPAAVSLSTALISAIEKTKEFAESRQVAFDPAPDATDLVLADHKLLVRALHALLETAIKFCEKGGTIRFSSEMAPDAYRLIIQTQGMRIPGAFLDKFFDLFSIGEAITPGGDLGLGPPVAYRILSVFGASVSVANREPSGIQLTVFLKSG
jgi:DNA-binding response OmpR family regulator